MDVRNIDWLHPTLAQTGDQIYHRLGIKPTPFVGMTLRPTEPPGQGEAPVEDPLGEHPLGETCPSQSSLPGRRAGLEECGPLSQQTVGVPSHQGRVLRKLGRN